MVLERLISSEVSCTIEEIESLLVEISELNLGTLSHDELLLIENFLSRGIQRCEEEVVKIKEERISLRGRLMAVKSYLSNYLKILLFFLLPFSYGCGYQLQGSGTILPSEVKRVYIPRITNRSTEPALTDLLTESLRDQFERYGVITISESPLGADAILEVTLLEVRRGAASSTALTDSALQLDSTLSISGELKRSNGETLWRNQRLQVTKVFGITQSSVVTSSTDFLSGGLDVADLRGLSTRELSRGQESAAFTDLAERAASQIYEEAVAPDF